MPLIRAVRHEAGHAVIALHYGLSMSRISVEDRVAKTFIKDSDWLAIGASERYVFLAGGIAGEFVAWGNYDRQGLEHDQKLISQFGGGPIETYLPTALEILRTHQRLLDRLAQVLNANWIKSSVEASVEANPDSFDLLEPGELDQLVREG
jgi:hypothetical protein